MAKEKEELTWDEHLRRGFKGLWDEIKPCISPPEEFEEHIQAACKEMLLAFRSLLDTAIERVEEKPAKKAKKIKVE